MTEKLPEVERSDTPRMTDATERCFLCRRLFRPNAGEPIHAGDGVELCLGCGALYATPGGCC